MTIKKRGQLILTKLTKLYPDAKISLTFSNDFEKLVSVMLSAQTTDKAVNKVTPGLFKKYPSAKKLAEADLVELENDIKSIGLYKTKAKNIKKASQIIFKKFNGKVPRTMDELLLLPGVGRKTANVVLGNSFGIAVDTHVKRLAKELGLSKNETPEKIERDLMEIFNKKDWPRVTLLLIHHGRNKLPLDLRKLS
jgi:endonuclease III